MYEHGLHYVYVCILSCSHIVNPAFAEEGSIQIEDRPGVDPRTWVCVSPVGEPRVDMGSTCVDPGSTSTTIREADGDSATGDALPDHVAVATFTEGMVYASAEIDALIEKGYIVGTEVFRGKPF